MVIRKAQVHHRLDGDGVVHNDRAFLYSLNAEYRGLRLVYYRGREDGAICAGAGEAECSTLYLVQPEPPLAGSPGQRIERFGQALDIVPIGVADDRRHQPALSLHGHADVVVTFKDYPVVFERRVQVRIFLQGLHRRRDEERQICERDTVLLAEGLLVLRAQGGHRRHVGLSDCGHVGRGALAADHVFRDRLAHALERDRLLEFFERSFGRFFFGRPLFRGRFRRRGLFTSSLCRDIVQQVVLCPAAVEAAAFALGEIPPVLARQAPDERGRFCAPPLGDRLGLRFCIDRSSLRLCGFFFRRFFFCRRRRGLFRRRLLQLLVGRRDNRQQAADLDLVALLGQYFSKRARRGRGNLDVGLVGCDLDQRLVGLYLVADLLEPRNDGSADYGFAYLRHDNFGGHHGLLALWG